MEAGRQWPPCKLFSLGNWRGNHEQRQTRSDLVILWAPWPVKTTSPGGVEAVQVPMSSLKEGYCHIFYINKLFLNKIVLFLLFICKRRQTSVEYVSSKGHSLCKIRMRPTFATLHWDEHNFACKKGRSNQIKTFF